MITMAASFRAGCGVLSAACAVLALVAAGRAAAGPGAAPQTVANDPRLRVLSPADGSFVSGAIPLRAEVQPQDAVTSVVFFADAKQLCTVVRPPFECAWDAGSKIIEHQIRVVANLVGGGRIVRNVRTKGVAYSENVEVDVVQVTATVVDSRGRYVKGLPQSAFHVAEDDRPQAISHFAAEDVPLELIVAVDISGSMGPSMAKMKKAVKEFLAAVPARHQVTLLGFNDTVIPLTRGSKSPEDRMKAVDRLAAWGGTALYDAILSAVDALGRQVGRKAIVVFSDGEDEGSHVTLSDVEQRLEASDVTLYTIGQGRGITLDSLKKILERLSRPTGGRALFTDSIDELHEAFNDLLDELSHQYLLGYPPTNDIRDNSIRRIKVTLDGPYQVRARQSYRAAPAK
jgi:Ca-activated chloride channel family protein